MMTVLSTISWLFMGLSILGGFLVTSKNQRVRLISFICWGVSNTFWVIFNMYSKQYSLTVLFTIYLVQAVIGIVNNIRKKEK